MIFCASPKMSHWIQNLICLPIEYQQLKQLSENSNSSHKSQNPHKTAQTVQTAQTALDNGFTLHSPHQGQRDHHR